MEWLLIGGVYAAADAVNAAKGKDKLAQYNAIYNAIVLDYDLEMQLWRDAADPGKHEELWTKIEMFRRDNPWICATDTTNAWGCVGKWRFIGFAARPGEKRTKAQEDTVRSSRQMMVDLLAVACYGKHSSSQAKKIANIKIFGRDL